MTDALNRTLQESLLTLLCHDDAQGKIVADLIDPTLFEGEMRIIAERAVKYWREQGQAPKAHSDDIVADILEDSKNRKAQTVRRILINMLQLSESINSGYVIDKLRKFTRTQQIKASILQAAQVINSKQEHGIEDVEELFSKILRVRNIEFEPGMRLYDYERVLAFLQNRSVEFDTGIKELDDRGFVPMRKAVMLMLAPTGKGKTWFAVSCGVRALMHRKKVLHITLELTEEETAQRYYQRMFAITKREAEVQVTSIKTDRLGRFQDIVVEDIKPEFTFASPYIVDELTTRIQQGGSRFDNLIIKKFPMRGLNMAQLRGYVDNLEVSEGFIPDMTIIDYFGVMKTDPKNYTVSLGREFEDFKGFCDERNMAGVTMQQVNRFGANSEKVDMTTISADWSMTNTADMVGAYTSTDAEFERGLGRFYVDKSRSEMSKYGVLMTQNYSIGQFCINSIFLEPKYFEKLEEMKKEDNSEDDDTRYGDNDDED